MKRLYPVFALLTICALFTFGCTKEEKLPHSGHTEHEQIKPGSKTAEIFENGRVVVFTEGAPVPAIDLIDQDGRKVTNEDLKGKVVLINFIYTNCEESCPIMMHKFMEIEKELKEHLGNSLRLVSISMDPERDTPEALKKYAEKMKTDTSYWTLLTGEKAVVAEILKGSNFLYQKNEDGSFGHSNTIVGLNREGQWKYNFSVLTVPVDILVERIKKEVQ